MPALQIVGRRPKLSDVTLHCQQNGFCSLPASILASLREAYPYFDYPDREVLTENLKGPFIANLHAWSTLMHETGLTGNKVDFWLALSPDYRLNADQVPAIAAACRDGIPQTVHRLNADRRCPNGKHPELARSLRRRLTRELSIYEPSFKGKTLAGLLYGRLGGEADSRPWIGLTLIGAGAFDMQSRIVEIGGAIEEEFSTEVRYLACSADALRQELQAIKHRHWQETLRNDGLRSEAFAHLLSSECLLLPGTKDVATVRMLHSLKRDLELQAETDQLLRLIIARGLIASHRSE